MFARRDRKKITEREWLEKTLILGEEWVNSRPILITYGLLIDRFLTREITSLSCCLHRKHCIKTDITGIRVPEVGGTQFAGGSNVISCWSRTAEGGLSITGHGIRSKQRACVAAIRSFQRDDVSRVALRKTDPAVDRYSGFSSLCHRPCPPFAHRPSGAAE